MLRFGLLTGERNNEKTLLNFFFLWEFIFKLNDQRNIGTVKNKNT